MSLPPRPSETVCPNCRKRPGTKPWGDALAMTHGFEVRWCEVCVYSTQLKHAQERAKLIPALERKLEAALKANR